MSPRRAALLGALAVLVVGIAWLTQLGAEERAVRRVLDDLQTAALTGLNDQHPAALDDYFATEVEGAGSAGLAATQQVQRALVEQLPGANAVQFHSFDLTAVDVHEAAGLAKVTYRLHFNFLRRDAVNCNAIATQNIALRKTPRGWRISGGDALQLEAVTGSWPQVWLVNAPGRA